MKRSNYNRKFARSQWRRSMSAWDFRVARRAGQDNSFRKFTGRCLA